MSKPGTYDIFAAPLPQPEPTQQERALTAFLTAFLAACTGPGEDVTPLEWLSSLLTECEDEDLAAFTIDPQAFRTAIRESRALLENLRAAVKTARGE